VKRRTLGLAAGGGLLTMKLGNAKAQTAANASQLNTTLTPFGAERAGNADGSIPAWTGGYTQVPSGWTPSDYMPDFFADEQPVLVVDASNMAQHADRLSEGVMAMMKNFGYKIKVYPTHRTACAPQRVYDATAANVTTAKLVGPGGRYGFTDAVGGLPFPLPETASPLVAGAQIMNNHLAAWKGVYYSVENSSWVSSGGNLSLGYSCKSEYSFDYYQPDVTLANFTNGVIYKQYIGLDAPQNLLGQEIIEWHFCDYVTHNQEEVWQLLNGEGRVRMAPNLTFDTPSGYSDGVCNYDEYFGFNGSPQQYNWTYLEKKEMYIPYNNNGLYLLPPTEAHLQHFIDPDAVRWELHRVWVVEANLAPDSRNVLPRRRFYHDEDTWIVGLNDNWDAKGNLIHTQVVFNYLRPDLPGLIYGNSAITNLQTGDFTTGAGPWNQKEDPNAVFPAMIPSSRFSSENMAAQAQY
jgi:hypothetical protein